MDSFYDLSFGCLNFQWRDKISVFIKNILISVSKINQSLMGLERQDGE